LRISAQKHHRSSADGFVEQLLSRVLFTDAGAAMRAELSECRSSIVTDDAAKHLLRVDSLSFAPGSSSSTMMVAT
jgi:hypothetical protein